MNVPGRTANSLSPLRAEVSIARQGDGTYRVLLEGCVGVLFAASLADAMALAYQLAQ